MVNKNAAEETMELMDKVAAELDSKNDSKRTKLERKLRRCYIVGGGAWQDLWEEQANNTVGFTAKTQEPQLPTVEALKRNILPELMKRFRDQITFFHTMKEEDYYEAAKGLSPQLPRHLQKAFLVAVKKDLTSAIEQDLGMRYFERILTNILIENKNYDTTR